jgi:phosphonopyruvate decarboxylase
VKDEPQHRVQGRLTPSLLETLGVPHSVLPYGIADAEKELDMAFRHMETKGTPYALVVRKDSFAPMPKAKKSKVGGLLREPVLNAVLDSLNPSDVVIGTTGFTSREIYELRKRRGEGHGRDFLTVGSMGHASAIALGVAVGQPDRHVYCLDGDGALLMHMGTLSTIGALGPRNLRHVVLNNGAHESVGGQPTATTTMDIVGLAHACGYRTVMKAHDAATLSDALAALRDAPGPVLLELKISQGSRKDLGRPTSSPQENKAAFMEFLNNPLAYEV